MRVFADRLQEHLTKTLLNAYFVIGNEPLLVQESRSALQQKAQTLGFDEKHRFSVDASLDWNQVLDCFQALSLFSTKQIVELELPESGVNATIAKELLTLSEYLHNDILLVIIGSKLTKAQENSKWFKSLSKNGALISCISPDQNRLPQFVQSRCRNMGLSPDQEAVQMLAQWHEGNLFALTQSLEKLRLLYPDGQLNLVRLEESLSRHNHFTAFHWIDALLAGKANRSQRILRQLNAEGTEAIILIRTLQKEIWQLTKMKHLSQTQPMGKVFEQYRIWQSKRPLYSAALNRLEPKKLQRCITLLAKAEMISKTQYEVSPWPILQQLSLELCQPQVNFAVAQ
ncbi:DNA polymerase III subunit delta [Vibrio mexicanus]|uniref:DNA polymerase III subunit delta n=1 Tax=Vibrio mexicanus TaxID=1004326 RepID=UPI00063CA9F8|nr:DNA polymerase III subunit delta [Vibrio mexicanus]